MTYADKIILIQDYYRGILKANDKLFFMKLLKREPSFRQDLNDYKAIFSGLESLHVKNFQNKLLNFEAKYQPGNKREDLEKNDTLKRH
jgi:hypothetical protein